MTNYQYWFSNFFNSVEIFMKDNSINDKLLFNIELIEGFSIIRFEESDFSSIQKLA